MNITPLIWTQITQIDPDNFFFNSINNDCLYYTDEQYNNMNKDGKLSIIHVNCRTLYANFTNIKGYLRQSKQPFNIIAISETWINTEKGLGFELEGYEFTHMDQQNKGGGGVAIYVDKNINFRILDNMTTTVNNLLECVYFLITFAHSGNLLDKAICIPCRPCLDCKNKTFASATLFKKRFNSELQSLSLFCLIVILMSKNYNNTFIWQK